MRGWRIASVAVVGAGSLLALVACGATVATDPPRGLQGREVYVFDDLRGLVSGAAVAVVGTVASAEPGRIVGAEEGAWRANIATIDVEQVLKGDVPDVIGFEETGKNGVPYLEEGERVVLFLLPYVGDPPRDDSLPYFVNIGSQGRFKVAPDASLMPANRGTPWVDGLRGIKLDAFVVAVRDVPLPAPSVTPSAG